MDKQRLIPIGIKEGMVACVSKELLAQHGEHDVKELLGITVRHFPVQTDLRGNVVMVEADSQEDAVRRYIARELTGRQRKLVAVIK